MKKILIFSTVLLCNLFSFSQSDKKSEKIISKTNSSYLRTLSGQLKKNMSLERTKAMNIAWKNNIPFVFFDDKGNKIIELQGVSHDGYLKWYSLNNKNAASTTSTDEVQEYGTSGLNLSGESMTVGEWDGDAVLSTHQEFVFNENSRITQKDGASSTSEHSTHVAGTLIAAGIQANAKGMAYKANLDAYDWNFDDSEMAAAAANGLLISNHSYGYISGWAFNGSSWQWYGNTSISTDEDYHFGFYGYNCKTIDQIAFNAPYYIICKSAGNDRGEGQGQSPYPPDGGDDGYDCIGWKGNAKNILTIGAVRDLPEGYTGNPDDVIMTSFSSWGPADDGRIKPDICGNGYNLFSTLDGNNSDYGIMSGTSMSSPNVAGSLLLLQEHFYRTHGYYMKSATLKALVINTADECGQDPGPDYMFGWGLMNTRKAADVITKRNINSIISEETYIGTEMNFDIKAKGNSKLIVTIVWTDLPGTPVSPQLDPLTPMLVNDIDIKVTDNGNLTFYPYKLDRNNPSAAAVTGENHVDNVEKIVINNPIAGHIYSIKVNHTGVITDNVQDFSIVVTGIIVDGPPTNLVASATSVSDINLTWNLNDNSDNVLLAWSPDGIFGVPADGVIYSPGDNLSGGGTILYYGNLTTFLHSGLSADKIYHYKLWSNMNSETNYSAGIIANEVTQCGMIFEFPFFENFEIVNSNNYCITQEFISGDSLNWKFQNGSSSGDPSHAFSGVFNAVLKDNDTEDNETIMILPLMNFENTDKATLTFWHTQKQLFSSQDELSVVYKNNVDDSWHELAFYNYSIDDWTKETINLPNLSNYYEIGFKGNARGALGICIDDIKIDDVSSIVKNKNSNFIAIYPNPSNGTFYIDFKKRNETANILISDLAGKILYSEKINTSDKQMLQLNSFAKGIYFVRINIAGEILMSELIVK